MSGEVEVPKTPEWLKALEEKREKRLKARLGHEAGAGAPCLKCADKCPGLDLHFWRKNCKICKCSKEDHDTHDDDIYSWAQFELLGSKPNKIKTKIVLPGKKDEVELEWAPKGQKDTIDKYLKTLPPEKIPVKGSQAAQERKQALQKQIPIHDIDPLLCHDLNEEEVEKMNEYIAHVKKSSVGVGQIINLSNVIKANLHNISPEEAHIIATRYSKGIPYTELVKLQAGLAQKLERLAVNDPKHKPFPNMQPQAGFHNKESTQNPAVASKIRDVTYQSFSDSDNQNNLLINPNYALGLPPKPRGGNANNQVLSDYQINEKLLQGTNFDPSKTPSQFEGYHGQGYRPMGKRLIGSEDIDQAQGYCDNDNNLLQNTNRISEALNQENLPYNVAYGENLQNPNVRHSSSPHKQQNLQILPYIQVREGSKSCGVENQANSIIPNYSQNLDKNILNTPNSNISYLPNIEHQAIPYNKIVGKNKAFHGNVENHRSQLPLSTKNLPEQSSSNIYGYENPLFNLKRKDNSAGDNLQNYLLNQPPQGINSENKNPTAPKNMKDLIYSTYDPNNPSVPLTDPQDYGRRHNKEPFSDINVPFDSHSIENLNTQHGSLGYVPGTNSNQIHTAGSVRHPLLDKYGNIESNPAYTDDLGSPKLKSGQDKVSGLKNLFEQSKNGAESSGKNPTNFTPSIQDPREQYDPVGYDSRDPDFGPVGTQNALKQEQNALYDPRGQYYDCSYPYSDPRGPGCGFNEIQKGLGRNQSAFYDPKGQYSDPNDFNYAFSDRKNPGYGLNDIQKNLGQNQSAFCDPRGHTQRQLPQMQPGNLNIAEEFVNPNQVNIGAIRDINYPDNEIKEAMIATNPGDDFYGEDYSPDSIKELLNNIILPNCHHCKKPFEENEFAITIERANVLFHAECFKCAGCNQSLADNIYFYHKESNNVYCGRDYAKIKGYPRCNACDELIFTKEYCLAENATFHLKHFCCFQCDTPLAGQEYTLEDEQPYCLPCFELTKASKCSSCQNVIKPDERGCTLNGVHFHAEDTCFACIVCKKPLMGQKLLLRNAKLYCSHDCFNSIK